VTRSELSKLMYRHLWLFFGIMGVSSVACIAPTRARSSTPPAATTLAVPRQNAAPTTLAVEWQAALAPVCPMASTSTRSDPLTDAGTGTIVSQSSTVDFAVLSGGTRSDAVSATPDAGVQSGTVSNASRVVAGMRADFRRCYQEDLGRDRLAAGGVRLTIHVGCEGSVIQVRGVATAMSKQITECMITAVRERQFAPPEGGSAVIAVPVTFVRE
jgi:hypothetical protein